jgi:hypothetical protein
MLYLIFNIYKQLLDNNFDLLKIFLAINIVMEILFSKGTYEFIRLKKFIIFPKI